MKNHIEVENLLRQELSAKRPRLIRLALDPEFLPDDIYEDFPVFIEKAGSSFFERMMEHPILSAACWIRAVFERCDGQNYQAAFRGLFGAETARKLTDGKLKQLAGKANLGRKSKSEKPFNRQEFLYECWMVGGGENEELGATSEVWKSLTPMVRKLDLNGGAENTDIFEALDELNPPPPNFLLWLIQDRDATFAETLRAMRANTEEGWLHKVARVWRSHANRPFAQASWMLYRNGNVFRMDMVVSNMYSPQQSSFKLSVKHEKNTVFERCLSGDEAEMAIRMVELEDGGMDFNSGSSLYIYIDDIEVAKLDSRISGTRSERPLAFVCPARETGWYSMLPYEPDNPPERYTRRIILAWPYSGRQTVSINNIQHQCEHLGSLSLPGELEKRSLCVVDLQDVRLDVRVCLKIGEEVVSYIGSKPFLVIKSGNPGQISASKFPESIVIQGDSVDVALENWPMEKPCSDWSVEDGAILSVTGAMQARITVKKEHYTRRIQVRCGESRIRLIFVPDGSLMGKAEGWLYIPNAEPEKVVGLARNGKEGGRLIGNGLELNIEKPVENLVWWWEKGLANSTVEYKTSRQFPGHGELRGWRLSWVDKCETNLMLNGKRALKGEPGVINYISLSEAVRDKLDLSDGVEEKVDELTLGTFRVAEIWRIPDRPVLTRKNEGIAIYFPEEKGFLPKQYYITTLREDNILTPLCNLPTKCCELFPTGDFYQVNIPDCQTSEMGEWLILWKPNNNYTTTLLDLCNPDGYIEFVIQVTKPGGIPLKDRIGAEKANKDSLKNAKGILDAWRNTLLHRKHGIFADALRQYEFLETEDTAVFWRQYLSCNARLAQFQNQTNMNQLFTQTLQKLMENGFNWCAEPGWAENAMKAIRESMDWKSLTKPRNSAMQEEFKKHCPLIPATISIRNGYPCCDQKKFPCVGFDQRWLKPQSFLEALVIRWPDASAPRFRDKGLSIKSFKKNQLEFFHDEPRMVDIVVDDDVRVKAACGVREYVLDIPVQNLDDVARFYCYDISGNCEIRFGLAFKDEIKSHYQKGIEVSSRILGGFTDGDLASLFTRMSDIYEENDFHTERATLFRAAVMCRMHVWWAARAGGIPQGWPMSLRRDYLKVCSVMCDGLSDSLCKDILFKDLILVEWLLFWFHHRHND